MKRVLIPALGALIASLVTAGCAVETEETPVDNVALAASVHLKGGRNAKPSFTDLGLVLQAAGSLAGLGNEDVVITLDATANPTGVCINPGSGQHEPPGQNPAPVNVTGSTSIPAEEVKNGNTPFSVMTDPPETPVPGAPDCPNPRWTEEITDMAFTSAVITVEQPAGNIVLTISCAFSTPTMDGAVPSQNVTCTSS